MALHFVIKRRIRALHIVTDRRIRALHIVTGRRLMALHIVTDRRIGAWTLALHIVTDRRIMALHKLQVGLVFCHSFYLSRCKIKYAWPVNKLFHKAFTPHKPKASFHYPIVDNEFASYQTN